MHYPSYILSRRLLVALPVVSLLLVSTTVHGQGGGVILYENGSPDMATSYAGAGARAQDAGTAFSNPAGLTRLESSEVLLGTLAIFSDIKFDVDGGQTVSVPPGSTDGGGHQQSFVPGLGSFLAMKITDDLRLGFTVNALAAAGVEYDSGWVGRTLVNENKLTVANFEPSLAYRVVDWLSVGAGVHLVYGKLEQRFKASTAPDAPDLDIDDADDWGVGGTFGLLLEPREGTRIGVTYRTQIDLTFSGHFDNPTMLTPELDSDFDLPQGFNVSLYQALTPKLALLADAGWTDWSHFDKQPTTIGPVGFDIPRDWDDTWRVGIGAEYQLADQLLLRSGFSYDSSPIDDDKRLPDIPVGEQFRYSLGLHYDYGEGKLLGLSYTFMHAPMEIDEVSLPGGVILDGEYDRSFLHIVGLTLNVKFGKPAAPDGGAP